MTFNTRMIVVKWYEITNIYIYICEHGFHSKGTFWNKGQVNIFIYIYIQPMKNIYMHSSVLYIYTHSKKLNNIGTDGSQPVVTNIYIYKQTYIYIYVYTHVLCYEYIGIIVKACDQTWSLDWMCVLAVLVYIYMLYIHINVSLMNIFI
jgi:hypothetical protein